MVYTVCKEDTWAGIAARYHTTEERLREDNGWPTDEALYEGARIVVRGYLLHWASTGDTLQSVAARFGVSEAALAEANPKGIAPFAAVRVPV